MTAHDEPLFDVEPAEPVELTCTRCSTTVLLPEDGARLGGWRIIHTTTQGGDPYHDVLCGSCSGRGPHVPIPSWDWKCMNCGAQFSDTYRSSRDVPLINAADAWASSSRHKCEPLFEFLPPGTSTWVPEWDPLIQHGE